MGKYSKTRYNIHGGSGSRKRGNPNNHNTNSKHQKVGNTTDKRKRKSANRLMRVSEKKRKMMGGARLPMEYYNPKYIGNYNSTNNTIKNNSAYGPIFQYSGMKSIPGDSNFASPNLAPYPNSSNLQTGGSHPYNYIRNPLTGRNVNIFGKTGKRVLKNYFRLLD
jgi:hypothetical protein